VSWSCPHCGSTSQRHVTDDVFRCNGCQQRVYETLLGEDDTRVQADGNPQSSSPGSVSEQMRMMA
jgi:hypothetical protein